MINLLFFSGRLISVEHLFSLCERVHKLSENGCVKPYSCVPSFEIITFFHRICKENQLRIDSSNQSSLKDSQNVDIQVCIFFFVFIKI